jgi:hypothetical protein
VLLAAALGLAATSGAPAETAAPPDFTGRWRLNPELSDKPPAENPAAAKPVKAKKAEAEAASKPKPADAAPSSGPAADAASEFTVRQSDVEIVAQDKSGQSRNFYPNGRSYKADEGSSDFRSFWKSGALVFEKKNARGWKYTETWQLTSEGRLRVDTRLSGGGQRTVETKRVYDKLTDPEPGAVPKAP